MTSTSTAVDREGRAAERRNHHRVLVGTMAWLVVDEQRYSAECVNVSMGGAAILSDATLRTGSVVRLELSLGLDRGSVSIQSEVVRASSVKRGSELGLRFLALDRNSLEAILALL